MNESPYCAPGCDRHDHLPCLDAASAKAEALAATGTEPADYYLGQMAAQVDLDHDRKRSDGADLMAPLDWLRGYDDCREEVTQ